MNINDSFNPTLCSKKAHLFTILLIAFAWNSLSCQSEKHSTGYSSNIYKAVINGDLAKIKLLLKENPKLVFSRDNVGQTPLIMAIYSSRKDVAAFLLANKAEVNAKTSNGSTPLQVAVQNDHKDLMELLLAGGSDVNAKDNNGLTPLHWAAFFGHKELAELLLANKAKINAKNNDGNTPLQVAIDQDRKEMAELLRQYGGRE
jgi:cytohesin